MRVCVIHHATRHVTRQEVGDNYIMSEIIMVTAPLGIEDLKKYFTDKETKFLIDYENSKLQGESLLVYLSNLEIPCDIKIGESDLFELASHYLKFTQILNIDVLENVLIDILLIYKKLPVIVDQCYPCIAKFIEDHREELKNLTSKLDSLTLYNMYIIQDDDLKKFVTDHPEDPTDDIKGINFVSLLKNKRFFYYYNSVETDNLKYYSKYFNDYMFGGKGMYSFWAHENNPMFILTWGISADTLNGTE